MSHIAHPEYKPFEDSNSDSDNALVADHLRDTLLQKIKDDEFGRLNPLAVLLEAASRPEEDFTEKVQQAIQEIQDFTARQPESIIEGIDGLFHETFELPFTAENVVLKNGQPAVIRISDHPITHQPPQFQNWGQTVKFQPSETFVVKSIEGVSAVVRHAIQKGKKVRVSGFRHTWSDLYGDKDTIMISFLPYKGATVLPYKPPPTSWTTELAGIQVVPEVAGRKPPPGHGFTRIMAGTTNDQLRQWSFDNKTYTIPFNVIMVEITFGGSNAPICHGSGFSTSTLSDLVVQVEYVDAHGNLQVVNDPAELRAASGSFGLLGVVVAVTLQLDDMAVAILAPVKKHLLLSIPPPKGYDLPAEVKKMQQKEKITDADIDSARLDFIQRCKNDYYLEWFWFPYQEQCWINTWQKRPISKDDLHLKAYPGNNFFTGTAAQQVQETLVNTLTQWPCWHWLSGQLQAYVFGLAAMVALPFPQTPISAYVSEALHFRRGIQNFRCLDTEWEIPIRNVGGERDYDQIARAWWDGISAVYSNKDAPVRVALEMRLTGSSQVLLAPQRGNINGSISIEVLTTLTTDKKEWQAFVQQVANVWTGYKDEDGKPLRARPHWAKQWGGLKIGDVPIEAYFKEGVYQQAFEEFRGEFTSIVEKRGSNVQETLARFGNGTMDKLIFS